MTFLEDLKWRGLIHQTTESEAGSLEKAFSSETITSYCGIDPTSDSLHIGSLLQVLNLVRLQKAGHRPIAVVGGATGMIGDPSGKSEERKLLDSDALNHNVEGLKKQLSRFLDFSPKGALLVNNYDWFKGFSYIDLLRDIGKHFSVNMMMSKESVRARLEDRDQGISYTEFSYMVLQAYDYLHLHDKYGCTLQQGGSDQWGNIVAGIDLIRRLRQKHVFGITFPLVTRSDGGKFGKSEKGNVWLDPAKTSPYEMYQFLIQTEDKDVVRFLKYFTFLSQKEIQELERCVQTEPEKRDAQKILAQLVTAYVHGKEEAQGAENAAGALFTSGDIRKMDVKTLKTSLKDAPILSKSKSALNPGLPILDLLVETTLCNSKGSARKDVQGGGIYLNNERLDDPNFLVKQDSLIGGEVLVLRKGKKTYHLVSFQ